MANDIGGIAERIKKEYKQEAEEMERTVPSCETCTFKSLCDILHAICDDLESPCEHFIPKDWQGHIYFNGEWWS